MDEIKKKIEELSAKNSLLIYAGATILMLLLFFCTDIYSVGGQGSISGSQVLFSPEKISTGMTGVFGWIAILSIIGITALAYTKKVLNWKLSIIPVVCFLIMMLFGSANVWRVEMGLSAKFTFWLIEIIAVAWVAFAYFRGDRPADIK